MPQNADHLPGVQGQDYTLVTYGGKYYVKYKVKLPNGNFIGLSWSVKSSDMGFFGLDKNKANHISKEQHGALQFFGDAHDVVGFQGSQDHPFKTFLKGLQERVGAVSWLNDSEFMGVMLMGFAEGWSDADIKSKLTTTKWFQSKTEAQRAYELDYSDAERTALLENTKSRLIETLTDSLYGPVDWHQYVSDAEVSQWALDIASGKHGSPDQGFDFWKSVAFNTAAGINGTTAWANRQAGIAETNAFANRPEELARSFTTQAREWLGPLQVPTSDTINTWAADVAIGKKSNADWEQFMEAQSKGLYPWLSPGEKWVDRAGAYKNVLERDLGGPVGWDDAFLQGLGQLDANGVATGQITSLDEFQKLFRKDDRFWQGPTATKEAASLVAYLDSTFNG